MKPLRVIVTGGATNIGRAITESFLERGGRVVVGQPDPRVAEPLLARHGDRVVALPVDVSDPIQCNRFVDAAAEILGGVEVLVNNAALTGSAAVANLADITPAHVSAMLAVNIGGVIFCSQAAARHLKQAGGGVIVHISSINAVRPQRGAVVYAASKAAVSSLAQSMAKELAADGIRVVAVAPGDIRIDGAELNEREMVAKGAELVSQAPLGRGRPRDVAETVAFLCSDSARFVTGVTWVVDGGLLA